MTPSHKTTEEGWRKGYLSGLTQQVRAKSSNKSWEYTESIVGWGKCLMLWSSSIWAEEKRREPRADLEMSCLCQMSWGEDVLGVVEQPIPTPQVQLDAEAGSNQAEGMHFQLFTFCCSRQMLLTFSGMGIACTPGRKLLKHQSNFKPGMDNRICPSTRGLTSFEISGPGSSLKH